MSLIMIFHHLIKGSRTIKKTNRYQKKLFPKAVLREWNEAKTYTINIEWIRFYI